MCGEGFERMFDRILPMYINKNIAAKNGVKKRKAIKRGIEIPRDFAGN